MVGGWAGIPNAFSTEIYAAQGWDSVTIDMQHGAPTMNDLVSMLQAVCTSDATPLVRVPWNDPSYIMRALDAGAMGLICPMINTKAEAEAYVRAGRYPPMGERSFGPFRAAQYAGADYWQHANEEVLLFAMIETRQAVSNLSRHPVREGPERRLHRPVRPLAQHGQAADARSERQDGAGGDGHHPARRRASAA